MTREEWLIKAAQHIQGEMLSEHTLPEVHISIGFPRGRGGRGARVGECWPPKAAKDGKAHIFISPIRDGAEVVAILATVLHELIHAAVGTEHKHRGPFVRVARAAGLLKPFTQSRPDERLTERLNALSTSLGPFPHGALVPVDSKRPGSRLRLWQCACPIKVRVASDDFHATCGDCEAPFIKQEKEEKG